TKCKHSPQRQWQQLNQVQQAPEKTEPFSLVNMEFEPQTAGKIYDTGDSESTQCGDENSRYFLHLSYVIFQNRFPGVSLIRQTNFIFHYLAHKNSSYLQS
ncbi:hypothetical protein M5D96_006588, partial [Drosophila gunungcola]